jgi:transglutaminase-like putative cysteine protease
MGVLKMRREPFDITIRAGCRIAYEVSVPTPVVLMVRPALSDKFLVEAETFSITPRLLQESFDDAHGNRLCRTVFQPGPNEIRHDSIVAISSQFDSEPREAGTIPLDQLPADYLRYTLPSRYCDSDKLLDFAWQHFGHLPNGLSRVRAISDWTKKNIEYRFGSGRPDLSASDIIDRGFGVCRDFAHVGIALCRAFNIPARYVTGHLPDIGIFDTGAPMDFHAYFEAYLGHEWCTFDPRHNIPRIGRVKVGHGLDAVDGAFTTIYGQAILTYFEVWAYQIDPTEVSISDPVDRSKRLDGTPTLILR